VFAFRRSVLSFSEHLFDGIEIGRIGRQEQQSSAGCANGLFHARLLWLARLSMMTTSPVAKWAPESARHRQESAAIDGAVDDARRIDSMQRRAARKVIVRQ